MCFSKKKKAEKAAAKEEVKKAPAKKEAPKAMEKKETQKVEEKKEVVGRTYHVVKRKEDGKWEVKYAGGQKAIKLFDTQKEALEYTKVMAENQDGGICVHASKGANKGKIRKK